MMIFIIQIFWLSFLIIGAAALFVRRNNKYVKKLINGFIFKLPVPALAFVAFAAGVAPFAVAVTAAYLLRFPAIVIELIYLLLLTASVIYCYRERAVINRVLKPKIPKSRTGIIISLLVVLSLAIDYVISLNTKGPLHTDAAVHIARIQFIATNGFSLADPYFGNHGIVDPRYSANLMLGLMGVLAHMFNLSALNVWWYSYGFMRLVIWLSIFTLAYTLLGKNVRRIWIYGILILSPYFLGNIFTSAEIPDRIVFAWVALGIAGIKYWLDTGNPMLLFIGALLIAVTHALYALMFAGFLAFLIAVLVIKKLMNRMQAAQGAAIIALLLLPVILNLAYPNRTESSSAAFNASSLSGSSFTPEKYGLFYSTKLPDQQFWMVTILNGIVLLLIYEGLKRVSRIENTNIKRICILLLAITAVLAYNPGIVCIGGLYLIWKSVKSERVRLLVLLLSLYYFLIAYNPLVVGLIHSSVPPWLVSRFQELNVIALIAPFIAWFFFIDYPRLKWNDRKLSAALLIIWLPMIGLSSLLGTKLFPFEPVSSNQFLTVQNSINNSIADSLSRLQPYLANQEVYSPDADVDYYVPAVVPNAHVITTLDTNYSPMVNIQKHDNCGNVINKYATQNDLNSAGVTRIVVYNNGSYRAFTKLIKSKPYIKPMKTTGVLSVYEVKVRAGESGKSACSIPWAE